MRVRRTAGITAILAGLTLVISAFLPLQDPPSLFDDPTIDFTGFEPVLLRLLRIAVPAVMFVVGGSVLIRRTGSLLAANLVSGVAVFSLIWRLADLVKLRGPFGPGAGMWLELVAGTTALIAAIVAIVRSTGEFADAESSSDGRSPAR